MKRYEEVPITLHTARVEHVCSRCGRTIQIGQTVAYQANDMTHQFISRSKFCEACFNKSGQSLIYFKRGKSKFPVDQKSFSLTGKYQ